MTVSSKLESVKVCTFSVAMVSLFLVCRGAPPPRPVPSRLLPLGIGSIDVPLSKRFCHRPLPRPVPSRLLPLGIGCNAYPLSGAPPQPRPTTDAFAAYAARHWFHRRSAFKTLLSPATFAQAFRPATRGAKTDQAYLTHPTDLTHPTAPRLRTPH